MQKPTQDKGAYTLAEAVETLFGIRLSKHAKLKNSLNSLIRNKTIPCTEKPIGGGHGGRHRRLLRRADFDLVHNAVILQGLVGNVRTISKILTDPRDRSERDRVANLAEAILVGSRSIVDISLLGEECICFVNVLRSDTDLTLNRLPNPFEVLPQLVLDQGLNAIEAEIAQHTTLSGGDSMMEHFLCGELDQAWNVAQHIETNDIMLSRFVELIEREYRKAAEFDDLLDSLK